MDLSDFYVGDFFVGDLPVLWLVAEGSEGLKDDAVLQDGEIKSDTREDCKS